MFADSVASLFRKGFDQRLQIVAFKKGDLAAVLAKQQVLVGLAGRNKSLTTLRLMHALNDVQLCQLFERAINGDQPQRPIFFARHIEDLNGGEGAPGILNGFHHGTARARETVPILL